MILIVQRIFLCLLFISLSLGSYAGDTIKLKVVFEQKLLQLSISKAPLKYNRTFAYSLTFDDGLASAFLTAFPLLNGGKVSPPFTDEWKSDQGKGQNKLINLEM